MSLVSPRVGSTSIESGEFPELAGHYEVYAVPKIVVNDAFEFTGSLPEPQFVETIMRAVNGEEASLPASGEQTDL